MWDHDALRDPGAAPLPGAGAPPRTADGREAPPLSIPPPPADAAPGNDADASRIAQLLSRLIGDSLAHLPPGPTLVVAAEARPGSMSFVVSTPGTGPADEAGGREPAARRLTLATARGIVEACGGEMGAESGADGPGILRFTLPAARGAWGRGLRRASRRPGKAPAPAPVRAPLGGRLHFPHSPPDGAPDAEQDPAGRMRAGILGEIHAGHLREGDRLPSIREIARELGITNWTVSHAYRSLAREGLVERRARSGVYVSSLERREPVDAPETADWLADVLTQASEHLVRVPIFPDLVRRYTASVRLRCACVESDADTRTALCAESEMQFGLDSYPVQASLLPRRGRSRGAADIPGCLREADILLTTAFHAPALMPLAEELGKPLVVATLDPVAVAAIERHFQRSGRLTVVCVDRRFCERLRAMLGSPRSARIRAVLAGDAGALAALDPAESVLVTRAASQKLEGRSVRLLVPRFPCFSRESAHRLAEVLIRLNLRAARA